MTPRDVALALAERIEDLVTAFEGDSPTRRSRSELRYRPNESLSVVAAGPKRGIWCDHRDGAGGDALDFVRHFMRADVAGALRWAEAWLGREAAATPPPKNRCDDAPSRDFRPLARRIFNESVRAAGTPAEAYLASRGLSLPGGDVIRFHPRCPRGTGERLPAMVAAMTDTVSNEFTGIHRTFLAPGGLGKIGHGKQKLMLAPAGVIRLAPDEEITVGLGICEGIETGLAIMQRAGWGAVWAAGSASRIAKFPVLPGIECLTIFPDVDDSGIGRKAAETCSGRWIEAGKEARIIWPPAGQDWDDALKAAA